MADGTVLSSTNEFLSPDVNIEFNLDEDSQNSGQMLENESNDLENDCDQVLEVEDDKDLEPSEDEETAMHENSQNCTPPENNYSPPAVGMEFESYEDSYNYYNGYSKELGFAIRIKSSWTKRNSKEKRGAVLCCNCEGFKTTKDANSRRRETRTGCLAMIRLRLLENKRWRVDEAKLEHNHLFDHERAQNSKSHKKIDASAKRKAEPTFDVEVRTIKMYRTPDTTHACLNSNNSETGNLIDQSRCMRLKYGDAQVIHNFFCRRQLTNPNFVYLVDLNDDGYLRNVFWIESRSRAAYSYFGDVVTFDSSFLSKQYEIPLFAFVGTNHHGHSILLGCGLVADETRETYIWLLRTWLTCMSGRTPRTIITDRCKTLQITISEVFPRAHHRISSSLVMQTILENLGESPESEAFIILLNRVVYGSLKADEFEVAWGDMIRRFGVGDHELLQALYDDRERWVSAYSKDTIFSGMFSTQQDEFMIPFFDDSVHKQTSLKEFFDVYESILQKQRQKETLDDSESKNTISELKTQYLYEQQLSMIYTNDIFMKFQNEVESISSCVAITQDHASGQVFTYTVEEQLAGQEATEVRNFEVMFDKSCTEVRCSCCCFNFKGYLCRHALTILNYNGVEEIPCQYILSRWRKDINRIYVPNRGSDKIDVTNPVQRFEHLYKRAIQVVEEGMESQDHYTVAWQSLKESLNKIRLVGDKHV